jgi:Flp pilus assembly protein TadD
MAYGRKGDLDKAIEHFQAAVDLAPGDGEARKNLLMAVQMKKTPGGVPPSDRP